jgi:DNA-binding LacI/PurR family transcriptional regulator
VAIKEPHRVHRTRPATSNDVARLAGCSQAAVSLWLNGKHEGRLKPDLQQRIAAAAAELGYVPNRTAQRLSKGGARSLSFLFPGYSYHFFGTILEGATTALGRDWELSFFDTRSNRDLQGATRLVSRAVGADTAGVLLASPSRDEVAAVAHLRSTVVIVDAPDAPETASLVSFDIDASVDAAAAHLAALGHRRIGYVSFVAESLTLTTRRSTVGQALRRRGLSLVGPDLRLPTFDLDATARAFSERLSGWRDRGVTAVLCADDRHAYGALTACRQLSVSVPEELSILAFNDSAPAALLEPSLSSIRLPAVELGSTAGTAMLQHITSGTPSRSSVQASWHPRSSTGPSPT